MSIYITADTHIPIDIEKLNTTNFSEQKEMTKNDYVIICGDFGGVWNNSNEDKYWLKWLNEKNFTTLFIDGNHENFDLLNFYPIEKWNGGKVHSIMPSVIHLMRGQVFNIDGLKFFTMGGAESHDKHLRKENISWWSQELPNRQEMQEGIDNLEKNNWRVDYIITHCAPTSVLYEINPYFEKDSLTRYLDFISVSTEYKKHYFGHYHIDKEIDDKSICLYDNIVKL